jgi:Ca2+/Na+ antiporter
VRRIHLQGSTWFLIFLMLVGLVFFVYALTLRPLQASLLGLITGPLLVVLGLLQLRKELQEARQKKAETQESQEELPAAASAQSVAKRFGWLVAWLVGLIAMIYLFGFLIAIPVFLIVFLKLHSTGWIKTLLVTAITGGIIYGLFEAFLERELWRGYFSIFG